MEHLASPDPVRPGAERRLRNLQRRFFAASARRDRTIKVRWAVAALSAIAILLVVYPAIWLLVSSPWPVTTTLRHIGSAPNCPFARLVGLAPARRGQPGYWRHHDRDGDGIACEPWPSRL
ncbi:excalibur calcium-binding domain-containing protein [Bradyrhizobium glycinis]|uniref:excalibur calcium-binding domain-containing protein n=1 Tax=Bradyrhizobium glycinis TaxID=2751812 RepID=UPI0018D9B13D|nr:excalibur calcium-binding domain-containing protein [Bradyrhizobium glycinis]MBH5371424.1 excalibur calcium-binding domain-containing protein [Bradyrhizobium glycinis]